jgi:hypothetical protein
VRSADPCTCMRDQGGSSGLYQNQNGTLRQAAARLAALPLLLKSSIPITSSCPAKWTESSSVIFPPLHAITAPFFHSSHCLSIYYSQKSCGRYKDINKPLSVSYTFSPFTLDATSLTSFRSWARGSKDELVRLLCYFIFVWLSSSYFGP